MFALAQLIRSYLDGEIDYTTFRREFVLRFLSVRPDSNQDGLVVQVESLCADVAEGEIQSESDLKSVLRTLPAVVQGEPVLIGAGYYTAASSSSTSSTIIPGAVIVSQASLRVSRELEYV